MIQDRLILRTTLSPFTGIYSDMTLGSVLEQSQLDGNFIHLKGHVIYNADINLDGDLVLYKLNNENIVIPIPDTGTGVHNELTGIQGGNATERIHLTQAEYDRLKALTYENSNYSILASPSNGERGVPKLVTLSYEIVSNDDVFVAASINNGIGNVLTSVDDGVKSSSLGNLSESKTHRLNVTFNRSGVSVNEYKDAVYSAFIPQWAGFTNTPDFFTYSQIESVGATLSKVVQSSAGIVKIVNPTSQYIWFISNKSNAIIKDGSGFVQSIGPWGDEFFEFFRKPLTLTLADGILTSNVYLYRSKEVKTLTNFTYQII